MTKRKAKIEIHGIRYREFDGRCWARYWWRLRAANGEIMFHSETFPTRSNAVRAAKRAIQLMKDNPEIVDG